MRTLIAFLLLMTPVRAEFFHCTRFGDDATMYVEIIHRPSGNPSLITRVTPTVSVNYEVLEATATHYRGHEVGDPFMKFHLDRGTSRFIQGRDIEPTSLAVLMELCDKKSLQDNALIGCTERVCTERKAFTACLGEGRRPNNVSAGVLETCSATMRRSFLVSRLRS
jgi:hypothetical protein